MQRWGLSRGQVFTLDVDSVGVRFVVVDQVDHVPTLYPETEDFLVADQAPLLDAIGYSGGDALWPAEVWLTVQAGADAADVAALRARPDVDSLSDRRQDAAQALRDPLLLQLEAHLLLGFTAALALAVVAIGVHFLVTVRSRLGEVAILRSNGLARRHIARSLAVEQGLLLGFAAAAGAAMGLGLAWTLIPSLQLGTDIATLVPAAVVRVDLALTGGAVAAVALLALAAGQLGARAVARVRLPDVLRLLG
jgi:predicted lysophospholipase L1 biosynthesis ABC-type transport system permease subunit